MVRKLALINAGRNIEFAFSEPLNLEYIAAYVQKYGIEVKIIDELALQDVRSELIRYKPDIVGITGTTPLIADTYRNADMCRRMGIKTVIGGVHVSVMPEEALEHADIVVKGEGEIAMLDIIQQDIKSGIVIGTPIKNLDDIPIFDKSGIQMGFYLRLSQAVNLLASFGVSAVTMIGSRGCSHSCTFCHNSWSGVPYRCNSVDRVIEEIRYLNQKYHINIIQFNDDNLLMNRPRLQQLCHRLIESNMSIKWIAEGRVDNVDLETLKLAAQAGCKIMCFGLESGSQRMLGSFHKKTTVEQNANAIQVCHEAGILAEGMFMIGCPTETVDDVRMTQQFIRDNPMDYVSVGIGTPYPGTGWWDWCKGRGLIPEHPDWSSYNFATHGFKKRLLACDTISIAQIEELYEETSISIPKLNRKISPKWLIDLGLHHPFKIMKLATRPSTWLQYLDRIALEKK